MTEKLPKEVPAEIAPEVPENVEETEPSTLVVTGFEELPEEILGQRLALGSSESVTPSETVQPVN